MQTIETVTNKSNNSDSNNKNTSNSISSSCDTASAPAKCLVNKKKSTQQMQPRKRGNRAGQVRRELIRESPIPSDLVQINDLLVAYIS